MEKWLKDDKLECSEMLGDLIMPSDTAVALIMSLLANCPAKVIQCMVLRGECDKIVPYAGAVDIAKALVSAEKDPFIDI